jgi:hypothetical protein
VLLVAESIKVVVALSFISSLEVGLFSLQEKMHMIIIAKRNKYICCFTLQI